MKNYNPIYEILTDELKSAFRMLPMDHVYELRLRVNCPVMVCVSGRSFFLSAQGVSRERADAVVITRTDIDTIVHKAAGYSLYSINEQIKQGFFTIRGGIRVGLVGELVTERGVVSTVKNIQSLNIRVPHEVRGCSFAALPYIFTDNRPLNTLIISPPGAGKTTFLRDIACQIGERFEGLNTLIIDERSEIAANHLGENQLDVGICTDVMTGSTKTFGFENGIRSMRPDVIITDEVATREDTEMVKLAARSGVAVIASVHASGIDEIRKKPSFRDLVDEQIFDRYIVLAIRDNAGAITGIFDKNLKLMAM